MLHNVISTKISYAGLNINRASVLIGVNIFEYAIVITLGEVMAV